MQIPLQIHYHNLSSSEGLEAEVRKRAQKLDEMFDRIISIRVTLEQRQHPRAGGHQFHVRLEVTIPGKDVIVSRDPGNDDAHVDMYVAVGDAFDAAKRQLETRFEKMRHQVKTHVGPPHATVQRLFKDQRYGFLATSDGREIFFHGNSVLGDGFDKLEEGAEVRFSEEEGEKGPQASTVEVIGKEGHHEADNPVVHGGRSANARF